MVSRPSRTASPGRLAVAVTPEPPRLNASPPETAADTTPCIDSPDNERAARDDAHVIAATCGCGVHAPVDGRRAIGVDADAKRRNVKRLRRIEGQVRGIQKMVEEDRYCADILTQLSSVHEALRSVSRELMRNHLKHCASAAIRDSEARAESMYDEIVDLMFKHNR